MADNPRIKVQRNSVALRFAEYQALDYLVSLSSGSVDSTLTRSQLESYCSSRQLLSIMLDNATVGFIAYRVVGDEAELDQILVAEEVRGRRVGLFAIEAWHDFLVLRGVVKVFLDVRETNSPALSLYLQVGYEGSGRRKGYYKYGGEYVDALLLTKGLT